MGQNLQAGRIFRSLLTSCSYFQPKQVQVPRVAQRATGRAAVRCPTCRGAAAVCDRAQTAILRLAGRLSTLDVTGAMCAGLNSKLRHLPRPLWARDPAVASASAEMGPRRPVWAVSGMSLAQVARVRSGTGTLCGAGSSRLAHLRQRGELLLSGSRARAMARATGAHALLRLLPVSYALQCAAEARN